MGQQICCTGLGLGCLRRIRSIHHLYTNVLDECVEWLQHSQFKARAVVLVFWHQHSGRDVM